MIFSENNLPEYIKKTNTFIFLNGQTTWVGKLSDDKKFYGMPILDYDYKGKFTIKNNCETKVEYLLLDCYDEEKDEFNIDINGYEIATKEEYEELRNKIIEIKKIKLINDIKDLQIEFKALEEIEL